MLVGCPACVGRSNLLLDVRRLQTEPGYMSGLQSRIELGVQRFAYGSRCVCRECGCDWVLNRAGTVLVRVTTENQNQCEQWLQQPPHLSGAALKQLQAIGAIASPGPEMVAQVHSVACAVRSESRGDSAVPVLVQMQDFPPPEPARLVQADQEFCPSPLALKASVRQALSKAWERSNLYAPLRVVTEAGQFYKINSYGRGGPFIAEQGVQGADLQVAAEQDGPGPELNKLQDYQRLVAYLPGML